MNDFHALRNILEFLVMLPGMAFAVLPVWEYLKLDSLRTRITAGTLAVVLVFVSAYVRAEYSLMASAAAVPFVMVLFAGYCLLFSASIGRKLFCFWNAVMLCTFCSLYTLFITAPIEAENPLWSSERLFTLKSCVVNLGLVLFVGAIFFRTLTVKLPMLMQQKYIGVIWDMLFLMPLFLTILMWWAIPIHPDLAMVGRLRPGALIFLWLILMAIWLVYHVFWWTAAKISEGSRLQQENTLLTMEGKRYQELRAYMDETRAIRHDFRQHILVIIHLAGSGNLSELQKYLQQFTDSYDVGYTGYCGNLAVDAVAAHYASSAEAQATKIEWHLNLPYTLPMNEAEYCAMLGNLTENALRAVKSLPEERRRVKVISSVLSETIIGLSIENPYAGKIELGRNGLPVAESEGHGVGLTSVRNTVERYGGAMDIRAEKGMFSVDIVLYCNNRSPA